MVYCSFHFSLPPKNSRGPRHFIKPLPNRGGLGVLGTRYDPGAHDEGFLGGFFAALSSGQINAPRPKVFVG